MGEKKAVWQRPEVGTKKRGQRGRMYGHGLGNVTARVRKREKDRKQTGYIYLAMPLKRGISLSQLQ